MFLVPDQNIHQSCGVHGYWSYGYTKKLRSTFVDKTKLVIIQVKQNEAIYLKCK